jgi:hypothetical protein
VRSVRPSHLIEVGVPLGIGLGRGDQEAPVVVVDRHFVGYEKSSAQPSGLRTEGKHGRDSSCVADPAGSNDRYGRHRVDHRRHQRQGRDATPDVAAGLPALRNDDVHSTSDGTPGFLGAADSVQNKSSGAMHQVDVALRIAEDDDTIRRPAESA